MCSPTFLGTKAIDDINIRELVQFIDWTPFFRTWDLVGSYPRIFDDEIVGAAAKDLYSDGIAMLEEVIEKNWITPRAVIGFWPANSIGDDIAVFDHKNKDNQIATLHTLRQQVRHSDSRPHYALSDFIAPIESKVDDHILSLIHI